MDTETTAAWRYANLIRYVHCGRLNKLFDTVAINEISENGPAILADLVVTFKIGVSKVTMQTRRRMLEILDGFVFDDSATTWSGFLQHDNLSVAYDALRSLSNQNGSTNWFDKEMVKTLVLGGELWLDYGFGTENSKVYAKVANNEESDIDVLFGKTGDDFKRLIFKKVIFILI
jgi:hypothetical protein